MNTNFFLGNGEILIGNRDANGAPTKLVETGNCPKFSLSLSTDVVEATSYTGKTRGIGASTPVKTSMKLVLELNSADANNLALGLYASTLSVTSGNVSHEVVTVDDPVAGESFLLDYVNVSNLVLTDSSGTPVTLVKGTHYAESAEHGSGKWLNVAGLEGPIYADYSYGAYSSLAMFNKPAEKKYIRGNFYNLANGDYVAVDLYNVTFKPMENLELINDNHAVLTFNCDVLLDGTKEEDSQFGQFGRYQIIKKA